MRVLNVVKFQESRNVYIRDRIIPWVQCKDLNDCDVSGTCRESGLSADMTVMRRWLTWVGEVTRFRIWSRELVPSCVSYELWGSKKQMEILNLPSHPSPTVKNLVRNFCSEESNHTETCSSEMGVFLKRKWVRGGGDSLFWGIISLYLNQHCCLREAFKINGTFKKVPLPHWAFTCYVWEFIFVLMRYVFVCVLTDTEEGV